MLQTTADLARKQMLKRLEQAPGYAFATGGAVLTQTATSDQGAAAVATDTEGRPMIVGSCFTTSYGLVVVLLVLAAIVMLTYIEAQRRAKFRTEAKLRACRSKIWNDSKTSEEHRQLGKAARSWSTLPMVPGPNPSLTASLRRTPRAEPRS